jgi:hypothetical protein
MKHHNEWNLEKVIKFHLYENGISHLVKEFPYMMFSVRNIDGKTRWTKGYFNYKLGCYVKYMTEYETSTYYKNKFQQLRVTIDDFYRGQINKHNIKNQSIKHKLFLM